MPFPHSSSSGERPGSQPEPEPSGTEPGLEPAEPCPRWREPRLSTVVAVVAVGGLVGAEARYALGLALPHGPTQWPWSTLLINTTGCVLIGVLMVVITELVDAHPLARPLLGVGFLGGYTTFSTYTVEIVNLVRAGRAPLALGYLAGTPVIAVLAAAAGAAATRAIATRVRVMRGGTARPRAGMTAPDTSDGQEPQ